MEARTRTVSVQAKKWEMAFAAAIFCFLFRTLKVELGEIQ